MNLGLWITEANIADVTRVLKSARSRLAKGWRPSLSIGPGEAESGSGMVVHFWCPACLRIHQPDSSSDCPPSDCEATRVCISDALYEAMRGDWSAHSAAQELLWGLMPPEDDLGRWEGEPKRTQADILAFFDLAIARSEAMRRAVQTFVPTGGWRT